MDAVYYGAAVVLTWSFGGATPPKFTGVHGAAQAISIPAQRQPVPLSEAFLSTQIVQDAPRAQALQATQVIAPPPPPERRKFPARR